MSAHRRRFGLVAAASLATALAVINLHREEGSAMANPSVQLGWEWRAERALEQRAGLRLTRIESEGSGWFGIGRSPSLGGSLPDARRVQAEVLAVDRPGQASIGTDIGFRIPKLELKGAKAGALVAIGIVGENVVCFAPAPSELTEASLADWISEAPCP